MSSIIDISHCRFNLAAGIAKRSPEKSTGELAGGRAGVRKNDPFTAYEVTLENGVGMTVLSRRSSESVAIDCEDRFRCAVAEIKLTGRTT